MEKKAPVRSAMVSRLPKFGGRSSTGGSSPVCNGSTQPASPTQDGKTTPPGTRPNGVIRASSFSLKWKKDEGTATTSPTVPGDGACEDKPKAVSITKEVKNSSPGTPKMRRSGPLMVAVSSPKAIPKQSPKMSPKVETKLGQSQMNGLSKVGQSGSSIPMSHLVRPRLSSGSPRSSSQDSLSQSTDSLKTLALDNMVRSNSFTHFKQIPSPTSQPMTRSFSFNRAVELAKPLANTQLRPPRRLQYSRTTPTASSLPTLTTPSAPSTPSSLKKPLLPNCVLTKSLGSNGGSSGYRLPRTGQKPLFPGRVKGDVKPVAAPESGSLLGMFKQNSCQTAAETLEDMSLSSASSLDRGDTSEEFLDDFDSTGDVLSDGDIPDNSNTDGVTKTRLQSFLNETIDWASIDMAGKGTELKALYSCGSMTSHMPLESSVELSPSNSSGGTYMWDEEGLEPLGGHGTHPCGSYDDSELNSLDILNNLDPLGTGDLDEDDLMLDVDLPEDGLHVPSQTFSYDCLTWLFLRMHGFQHYDGLKAPRISSRPMAPEGRQHGYIAMLDELTLEHMSQDCSSLKNQLLRLKTLLQVCGVFLIWAIPPEETNTSKIIPPYRNIALEACLRQLSLIRSTVLSVWIYMSVVAHTHLFYLFVVRGCRLSR
uniref:Coiled-coil serine-rich protein 2a n=1 Tax=Sphaeramia orbicularis TaxID=375764 RepID=A0A673CNI1_9TELE